MRRRRKEGRSENHLIELHLPMGTFLSSNRFKHSVQIYVQYFDLKREIRNVNLPKQNIFSLVWHHMSVIPALGRLK
jgi:hypothetical protein